MKSIMVGIRFKEDIYQALQARAGQGSVADYIRELVTKSVNSGVNSGVNSQFSLVQETGDRVKIPEPEGVRQGVNSVRQPDNPVQPDPQFRPNRYADSWKVKSNLS